MEDDTLGAKEYGSICFGSLNEVINDDDLVCLGEGKAQVKVCSTMAAAHLKIRELLKCRSTGRARLARSSGLSRNGQNDQRIRSTGQAYLSDM